MYSTNLKNQFDTVIRSSFDMQNAVLCYNGCKDYMLATGQPAALCVLVLFAHVPSDVSAVSAQSNLPKICQYHSLCKTTIKPIIPSMTCFNHGCSLSRMVTYPTKGMKPTTLPITSSLRLRKDWPCA